MIPYYEQSGVTLFHGEALDVLRKMPDESIHCCITSPPYWNLRSYGVPPSILGGNPECHHEWVDSSWRAGRWADCDDDNPGDKQLTNSGSLGHRGELKEQSTCSKCSAWLGCFGLEPTPEMYIEHAVEVFREVRRVLRADSTLWINIGDCWANDTKWGGQSGAKNTSSAAGGYSGQRLRRTTGLKPKDLVGIPWMLAFALRADGFYLRQEIIWSKPNAFPESVGDRPTKSHEQIFLLSKSERYFYDADAIKEPASDDTHARYARGRSDDHKWADGGPGNQTIAKSFEHMRKNGVNQKASDKQSGHGRRHAGFNERWKVKQNESFSAAVKDVVDLRNKRSVWTVPTHAFPGSHFATFAPDLILPAVLAGCPVGGTILDPFSGAATTALVAKANGRKCVGIELNQDYLSMSAKRLSQEVLQFT